MHRQHMENGRCIISQQFAQVRTQIKDNLAGVLFFTEPWIPRDSDTCTYTRHRADDGCAQGVLCHQFAAWFLPDSPLTTIWINPDTVWPPEYYIHSVHLSEEILNCQHIHVRFIIKVYWLIGKVGDDDLGLIVVRSLCSTLSERSLISSDYESGDLSPKHVPWPTHKSPL